MYDEQRKQGFDRMWYFPLRSCNSEKETGVLLDNNLISHLKYMEKRINFIPAYMKRNIE